jgi:hypothetical protein
MTAGQTTGERGARHHDLEQTPAASSAADLTESMMHTYGQRVPLDVIARVVHDVQDAQAHPRGAPVPRALGRQVVRRLRDLIYAEPAS